MNTFTMSLAEYLAEKDEDALAPGDKLARLTSSNERLNTRSWTEAELQAIPENMLEMAFGASAVLQAEFGDLGTLQAYLRACRDGVVRRWKKESQRGNDAVTAP